MPKEAEFLECQGSKRPGNDFLLEYQKSILFVLEKEGILDPVQLDDCIRKLENRFFMSVPDCNNASKEAVL